MSSYTVAEVIARVRLEIGDPLQTFNTNALTDGIATWYDLPKQQIDTISQVAVIDNAEFTLYTDFTNASAWSSTTAYTTGALVTTSGSEYFFTAAQNSTNQAPNSNGTSNAYWTASTASAFVLNYELGQLQLGAAPPVNCQLIVNGTCWSLFSDTELGTYVQDAVNEHCFNRTIQERFYDAYGRITYRDTPMNLANLPAIEFPLVSTLAIINTFWALANDTATDFNVQTAEGTNIDRTSQYQQIINQINLLQSRYEDYCGQLNVGMYRVEVFELRRTSYTTGRMVPVFKPQEYDDHRWPTRILPERRRMHEDNSGIPAPIWNANSGGSA
jgi:hypothetical protein